MMIAHVGKQRGNGKCTVKEEVCGEGGTGNAQGGKTVEWISRQRREDTRKVAEKCMGWERKDLLFLGLI